MTTKGDGRWKVQLTHGGSPSLEGNMMKKFFELLYEPWVIVFFPIVLALSVVGTALAAFLHRAPIPVYTPSVSRCPPWGRSVFEARLLSESSVNHNRRLMQR